MAESAEQAYEAAEEEYYDEEGEEQDDGEYEEEGSEDSEDDNRREYGIYPCLPVEPGEPDWESGDPQTVEEYLRRVRFEAQQLPNVVTAAAAPQLQPADQQVEQDQQTAQAAPHSQQAGAKGGEQQGGVQRGRQERQGYSRYLAADPGVPACNPRLQPSATWIRDFLRQFAQLRRCLQREYELTSGQVAAGGAGGGGMLRFAPGTAVGSSGGLDVAAAEELAALRLDPPSAAMPELMQLQGQDQLQVRRQLHAALRAAVQEEAVAPEAAALIYALSARIEKPLHAGTCALYRQLLRHCAAQRAALGAAADDPRLPHLNILVTLAGAFFGQDEELATMWDDDEE